MTFYLKVLLIFLLFTNFLNSYTIKFPTLDINEMKFKQLNSYSLKDFKISRKIKYFEIISFTTKEYIGKDFELKEPFTYDILLKVGTLENEELANKSRKILANIIIKENYFWKIQEYPSLKYKYTLLNYYEKRDSRMKAIENQEEIKKILKKIDTEAELLLWIKVINRGNSNPYSYKYINKEYRVRFFEITDNGCHIKEYFEYFNKKGVMSKSKLIKDENIEGCKTWSNNL